MNVIAEIQRINERELALGVPFEASWHQKYRESAWVYVGGLPFELTEGDVLCVFSQFGEVEDLNLVRDAKTGKSRGFAFIKFEDQRSTVLAVDNFNGARLLERVIRVDHVLKYKLPKELQDREDALSDSEEEEARERERTQRGLPGHAYEGKELASEFDISKGQNVFAAPEESKKERKRRRKEEKKHEKEAKKLREIEKKQQKLFEEIQKKRQAQRAAEELERQRAARDGEADGATPAPSATGWRGRLEPNAVPPPRGKKAGAGKGDARSSQQQDKSYGGINRVR